MVEIIGNVALSPIALKLRTLRKNKNISQDMLATISGIPIEKIIFFENDKAIPSNEELNSLLSILI